MVFEHFAIHVVNVEERVLWYTVNLGLSIQSRQNGPPFMTFLADVIVHF